MDKPATVQRKTGSRTKKTGTRSRASAQRKSGTATAKASASSRRARASRKAPVWHPSLGASRDDRKAILLLVAPFALFAMAVGGTQALDRATSMYRQLAHLSGPVPAVQILAPQAVMSAAPESVKTVTALADRNGVKLLHEVPASIALRTLPPRDSVVVRLARKAPVRACIALPKNAKPSQSTLTAPAVSPVTFGYMLARAARAQTRDLVVYTDQYRQIGFPMGDVPNFYGVCTDVVIRAYRALGIDLQVLVHKSHLGTGDTSIDHRRTKTLRRFFARYGESIPVTDFAEDYLPGDIVTYYRAGGRTSQAHIAIVSDVIAPSGRPMIVHNRGWGPQLEDALFANNLTGHYRFSHVTATEQARAGQSTASPTLR